jgi:hypothetical protein
MHRVVTAAPLTLIVGFAGCLSAPDESPDTDITAVLVSPASATVQPGAQLQLSAHVTGTSRVDQDVVWSARASDRSYAGSVTSQGLFSASSFSTSRPVVVTITATSSAKGGVSGHSEITIPSPSITLEADSASVAMGGTLQIRATLNGIADPKIGWSASPGTVDSRGLYRAPPFAFPGTRASVTATVTGLNLTASVGISLTYRPPVITALSGPVPTRRTLRISGTGFQQAEEGSVLVSFPTAGPRPVEVQGICFGDTSIDVEVPAGVVSGPLRVSIPFSSETGRVASDPAFFTHTPALRLHADRTDLAPGEKTNLTVVFLGSAQSWPVSLDADVGTFDGDRYVAPTVDAITHATVRACLTGTSTCSGVVIAVHPFRIEPDPAIVPAGGSIDFVAVRGDGPVPVTFTMVSGAGTVTPDGQFVAPSSGPDSGPEIIAATDGAHEERLTVAVRGLSPGLVARIADHIDHDFPTGTPNLPWGTTVEQLAVDGNRAYALGRPASTFTRLDQTTYWLDAYDVTDPARPRWLTAVEMATHPAQMIVSRGRLYGFNSFDETVSGLHNSTISIYDVSGPIPVLLRRVLRANLINPFAPAPSTADETSLYVFSQNQATRLLQVEIYSLDDAFLDSPRTVQLPFNLTGANAVTARDGRVYATLRDSTLPSGNRLEAWDVSSVTAERTAVVAASSNTFFAPLDFAGPYLAVGGCFYDTRDAISLFSCGLPGISTAAGGSLFLARGNDIVNISEPAGPRIVGHVDTNAVGTGGARNGLILLPEGEGGIAVYDISAGLAP